MKHETYEKYLAHDVELPQRALLTAWDCLSNYHTDLVLAGGLAIKFLTHPPEGSLPGPVTLDVDFCIHITATSGQYGNIKTTLSGHGFDWDTAMRRFVRKYQTMDLYIDLITDDGKSTGGTVIVDDSLPVSTLPGVGRALERCRQVEISGKTLVGAESTQCVKIAEVGPMLALKLNAFGGMNGRKAPKDTHDILYLAMNYLDGVEAAVADYHAEREAGNRAVPLADKALRDYFLDEEGEGALACATFRLGENDRTEVFESESLAIRTQLVTLAHALLSQ